MFRFMSRTIQEQIIGYIKVDNEYLPAVSDSETFSPHPY